MFKIKISRFFRGFINPIKVIQDNIGNPVKQAEKAVKKAEKAIKKAGTEIKKNTAKVKDVEIKPTITVKKAENQMKKVTSKVNDAKQKVNSVVIKAKDAETKLKDANEKFDKLQKKYDDVKKEVKYADISTPSDAVKIGKEIASLSPISGGTYESNKKQEKKKIEEGWIVAYGGEITEIDLADGVVAAGTSVFAENPGPFIRWVTGLVNRTIEELEKNIKSDATLNQVKNDMINFSVDKLKELLKNKKVGSFEEQFGDFGVKAGLASYSGKNKTSLFGKEKTVSTTNAWQPYVAIKKLSKTN